MKAVYIATFSAKKHRTMSHLAAIIRKIVIPGPQPRDSNPASSMHSLEASAASGTPIPLLIRQPRFWYDGPTDHGRNY